MILYIRDTSGRVRYYREAFAVRYAIKRALRKYRRKVKVDIDKNGGFYVKVVSELPYDKEMALARDTTSICKHLIRYGYNLKVRVE